MSTCLAREVDLERFETAVYRAIHLPRLAFQETPQNRDRRNFFAFGTSLPFASTGLSLFPRPWRRTC